jgi:3-deoxy-D-manno-octulosonic-acid transferase
VIVFSKIAYNVFLAIYYSAAWLLSLFRQKEKLWIDGRKETFLLLKNQIQNSSNRIWFHCSSLGEFEQARPLIESIKQKLPDATVYLSFFSPSGYEIRKNYPLADFIFYLPFDSRANSKRLLDLIQPNLVFWTKYDFWYYILDELKTRKIEAILFSANFRSDQIFFQRNGFFFREMLKCFSKIFVQNQLSKELLKSINIESEIAADTRFDRVFENAATAKRNEKIEIFTKGYNVIVAGSAWPKDEQIIRNSLDSLIKNNFKIIVAPHEIDEHHLNHTMKLFEEEYELYSALREQSDKNVLIIDNIGMLSSIYKYADIAYVGGGFNKSVHNVLEPAANTKPIIIGPNHQKSMEAIQLIKAGAVFVVQKNDDFASIALKVLNKNTAGEKAGVYVKQNIGGTKKILTSVLKENY